MKKSLINTPKGYVEEKNQADGNVYVTHKLEVENTIHKTLKLIRRDIVLGIGCRKDYDINSMEQNVMQVLRENNIDFEVLKKLLQ